jgi:hypothetical protein
MERAAPDDWREGQLIVAPHAWWGDPLWTAIQAEVQDRIGAALRAMYAELLLQPLSLRLARQVFQIKAQHGTSRHGS